jgi:hypothetical protein
MVRLKGVELDSDPLTPIILTSDVPGVAVSLAENVTTVDAGDVDGENVAVTPSGNALVVNRTPFAKPPVVETVTVEEPLVR